MSSANGYSVVPITKAILPLRIIQLILGVGVIGLSGYLLSINPASAAGGLGVFTGIATIIYIIYWFVANSPNNIALYNYWAIFSVELFVLIFWLCTFALLASRVSLFIQNLEYYDSVICYGVYCYNFGPLAASLYTVLAISVLNFFLFAITFTIYTIRLFMHRAALPKHNGNATTVGTGPATVNQMEGAGVSHLQYPAAHQHYPAAHQNYLAVQPNYSTVQQNYPSAYQRYPTTNQNHPVMHQQYPTAHQQYPQQAQNPPHEKE